MHGLATVLLDPYRAKFANHPRVTTPPRVVCDFYDCPIANAKHEQT